MGNDNVNPEFRGVEEDLILKGVIEQMTEV